MKAPKQMTSKGRTVEKDEIELDINILFHFCQGPFFADRFLTSKQCPPSHGTHPRSEKRQLQGRRGFSRVCLSALRNSYKICRAQDKLRIGVSRSKIIASF